MQWHMATVTGAADRPNAAGCLGLTKEQRGLLFASIAHIRRHKDLRKSKTVRKGAMSAYSTSVCLSSIVTVYE